MTPALLRGLQINPREIVTKRRHKYEALVSDCYLRQDELETLYTKEENAPASEEVTRFMKGMAERINLFLQHNADGILESEIREIEAEVYASGAFSESLESLQEKGTKYQAYFQFLLSSTTKTVITQEDMQLAETVRGYMATHPYFTDIFPSHTPNLVPVTDVLLERYGNLVRTNQVDYEGGRLALRQTHIRTSSNLELGGINEITFDLIDIYESIQRVNICLFAYTESIIDLDKTFLKNTKGPVLELGVASIVWDALKRKNGIAAYETNFYMIAFDRKGYSAFFSFQPKTVKLAVDIVTEVTIETLPVAVGGKKQITYGKFFKKLRNSWV